MPTIMTQQQAVELFIPVIRAKGEVFRKKIHADCRRAVPGEIVVTSINGVKETQNTAREGDWVIRPRTGAAPAYIITAAKFADNWDPAVLSRNGEWEEHAPLDSVTSRRQSVTYEGEDTSFLADWGEEMILRSGDQIAAYVHKDSEVFRIEQGEFAASYEPI
jgi:hypothetical protein